MLRKRNKQRERERERERVLAWMVRTFVHAYSSVVSGFFEDFVLLHTLSLLCSDPLAYASYEITSFVNWTAYDWEDGTASCSVDSRWDGKCEHKVPPFSVCSRACSQFQCALSKFTFVQHDHICPFGPWRGRQGQMHEDFIICTRMQSAGRQVAK